MKLAPILVAAWICAAQSPDGLKLVRVLELKAATHHVQGVDSNSKIVWATSVDTANKKGYLHEFSLATGESSRTIEIQDEERFHPGGFASDTKTLWVPVAEYRRASTSVIQRRSKKSFQVEFQFAVPDHIGCVAVTRELLIGGNWDSRTFYIWNHRGELVRKIESTTGNAYQDMKFDSNYIVASGLLADRTGAVDWLDPKTMTLVRRLKVGNTDRGAPLTREGMSIRGRQIMFLPEDAPSRLFVFRY